jgi:cytochrome c oxidase subunit IV
MNNRKPSGKPYVLAWLGLLVLTATSLGAHYVPLGPFSIVVALAIALAKTLVVALIFMHLLDEPFTVRFVAGLNVVWVVLLCAGIALDIAAL